MKLEVRLSFSPDNSISVGTLADSGRDTAFEYDRSFLALGLSPAPFRLTVKAGAVFYDHTGGMETFGLFEDSLPDGWGRRLVDRYFQQRFHRLPTVLERLAVVGGNGMGALVYQPSTPIDTEPMLFDLAALAESAMDFDAGRSSEVLAQVRQAGGSSGGARPKAFVQYHPVRDEVRAEGTAADEGFEHWLVKFNTRAEGDAAGEREYAYYKLAIAAGAKMMPSCLLKTSAGSFFSTKRFDRGENGTRLHVASAAGLLHADFRVPGEEYSLLFRLTDALTHDYSQKCELFRRTALNVLAHNRDDHLKNFAFLMDSSGRWQLAPFYDFTYSKGPNGWQMLSVAGEGADPDEHDLLRLAKEVSLKSSDACEIIDTIRTVMSRSDYGQYKGRS